MPRENERRDVIAMAMVLLAERHDIVFRKQNITLTATTALRSVALVSDLMRFASYAINLHRDATRDGLAVYKVAPGEDILLTCAFDMAVESVPRIRRVGAPDVIDLDMLSSWIGRIEESEGSISIDQDLVTRVSAASADRLKIGAGPDGPAMMEA